MFLNNDKYLMVFPLFIKDRIVFFNPSLSLLTCRSPYKGLWEIFFCPKAFGPRDLDSVPASETFKGFGKMLGLCCLF